MADENVLIIEDDQTMLRGLKDNFQFEGYLVSTADDGEKGLNLALKLKPDLIILDIMLPVINGYEICRKIRRNNLEMPIIMLTAKGQESDIILGLNLGADDYVTKPFSITELLARANAFLRRRRDDSPVTCQFGHFLLDLNSRKLKHDDNEITLTPKEFDLLKYFATSPGRALTRQDILQSVWGNNIFVTSRSVDRCVNTLRKKIEQDPTQPTFIKTIREIGYRFEY